MLRFFIHFTAVTILTVGVAVAGAKPASAATTTTLSAQTRPLRIGYLGVGLEVPLPPAALDGLAAFLEADAALRAKMTQNNLKAVHTFQIDSFQEMLDRLNHREFDVAYCPAKILVEQTSDYQPILQLRPPKAISDSSQSRLIAWRGVIIGSRQAERFSDGPSDADELAAFIRGGPMAFPSAHSAVGYIYPLQTLRQRFDATQPGGFIFLGSSREVARAVINGLIPIGACEEGALLEVVEEIPLRDGRPWRVEDVVEIIARTPPVPTDPIIVRADLAPERSALGMALRDALRRFHDQNAALPKVGESAPKNYERLREDLLLFRAASAKGEL